MKVTVLTRGHKTSVYVSTVREAKSPLYLFSSRTETWEAEVLYARAAQNHSREGRILCGRKGVIYSQFNWFYWRESVWYMGAVEQYIAPILKSFSQGVLQSVELSCDVQLLKTNWHHYSVSLPSTKTTTFISTNSGKVLFHCIFWKQNKPCSPVPSFFV